MRLLFAARAIDRMAGGVERMIITIMNAMVARGHDVELITWDVEGAKAFYAMDPRIVWHQLNIGDPMVKADLSMVVKRATTVRALLSKRRPDVIVAFQDGPFRALWSYCIGLGIPVIAAERNAPTRFEHTRQGARRSFIVFNAFRFAKSVVVQCEGYRHGYPSYLHKHIVTIPNPVPPAVLRAQPECADKAGRYRVLSVGRLSYQKNPECLIDAFGQVADGFPKWDLVILGDGELREKLEDKIAALSLSDRILLPGTVPDPNPHYANAHLFCLASRWEGFPNALAEAQAHGLPAIGFADCAGTNELIDTKKNGLLAQGNGDCASLASALATLMRDPSLRSRMGSSARDLTETFAPDGIMDRWESLFARSAKRQ
ncbi:Glycosyl transferase, group 1 [Candidatus Filomicrobium marinum]|uniref:Glycosyl transferase, group 1 n=1 Tax=Candidatus Filomicrobium marinum TaxID=1608628 RepID=A0A0D6JIE8_9HYPH|nr:glycosyltransferase family 4 protein [Candidatus Filomicrobium marinum]CFX36718.1 Glycosyl transferase, group 1 [Candidatus Filomicrobium marinum]CPR21706.1 Glycosyl transferase, group 1 [Candidatus Filomicrobium marinum]